MIINKEQLEELLAGLYALDPSLKERREELIAIIEKIASSRPDTGFDPSFARTLKAELMEKALLKDKGFTYFNFNLTHMKKYVYMAVGILALAVIFAPAFVYFSKQAPVRNGQLALGFQVNRIADNSFGRLAAIAPAPNGNALAPTAEKAASSVAPRGLGGGGGGGGGGDAALQDKMILPYPYEQKMYRLVYKGGDYAIENGTMDVLRRVKGVSLGVDMPSLVSGLNFGLMDLDSFSGLSLQNISLVQKNDFGYVVNIAPEDGIISAYQNWETWPMGKCGNDQACYEAQRVKPGDMPSEPEVFAAANAFLDEHNIRRDNYGDPEIIYNPMRLYEASTDKANFYFPETIDVVYPVRADGKFVYDEYGGNKQGLNVSYNIKEKRVAGFYNLAAQKYDSSGYAVETDMKRIIAYAERGGVNNYLITTDPKAEELTLGAPVLGYTMYYKYEGNRSIELLVPALYFPIENHPVSPEFNRKAVVVPIVQDILAERENMNNGGVIMDGRGGAVDGGVVEPMPGEKPLDMPVGSESGSAGSGETGSIAPDVVTPPSDAKSPMPTIDYPSQ